MEPMRASERDKIGGWQGTTMLSTRGYHMMNTLEKLSPGVALKSRGIE